MRRVDELSLQVAGSQSLVAEHEDLQSTAAEIRKQVESSKCSIHDLQEKSNAISRKREAHKQLETAYQKAGERHSKAHDLLERHKAVREQLAAIERNIAAATESVRREEKRRLTWEQKINEFESRLKILRKKLNEVNDRRNELDDNRSLVELETERIRLTAAIGRHTTLETELTALRSELAQIVTADKKELNRLRKNRREADSLRAEIDAAALRLEIEPTHASTLQLSVDTEEIETIVLQQNQPQTRQFRQRLEIELDDVGTIRIVRGQDDASLDESARKVARLNDQFADAMAPFGIVPGDEQWEETLIRRGVQREEITKKIDEKELEERELAPEGRATAERQLEQIGVQRLAILERHPTLEDWTPNTDDIREAPAVNLIDSLLEAGAKLQVHDPRALGNLREIYGQKFVTGDDAYAMLKGADALVVVTEWNEFRNPDFKRIADLMKQPIIFDGRNLYESAMMQRYGFEHYPIGRPATTQKPG